MFAVWEGAPPAGVIVPPGSGDVSVERATLPGPLDLSTIFPQLNETALGNIVFKNVSILHQSHLFDKTRSVGWHLDAEMVIDGRCGALHEALVVILDYQPLPENKDTGVVVTVHAELDAPGGWAHSLDFQQLILEGVLEQFAPKPLVNELIFTRVGVRLQVNRRPVSPKYAASPSAEQHPDVTQDFVFDFAVNGTAELSVPNSVIPLKLDYEIREQAGTARFSAKGDTWDNPLGVKGLVVSSRQLYLNEVWINTVSSFVTHRFRARSLQTGRPRTPFRSPSVFQLLSPTGSPTQLSRAHMLPAPPILLI